MLFNIRSALWAVVVLLATLSMRCDAVQYDEHLAQSLLVASSNAYSKDPSSCPWQSGNDVEVLTFKQYKQLAFFTAVDHTNNHLILSFRGTDNISQLMKELWDSGPIDYRGGGKIVHYFSTSYDLMNTDVITAVDQLIADYPTLQLYITGHSLGGALACLAALDYYDHNPIVYTFGQPRVGDYTFSQLLDNVDTIRVTHRKDVVVHIPTCPSHAKLGARPENPSLDEQVQYIANVSSITSCYPDSSHEGWPNFGYHNALEVYYKGNMPTAWVNGTDSSLYKLCTGDPYGEDPDCANGAFADSISDHTHYFDISVGSPKC